MYNEIHLYLVILKIAVKVLGGSPGRSGIGVLASDYNIDTWNLVNSMNQFHASSATGAILYCSTELTPRSLVILQYAPSVRSERAILVSLYCYESRSFFERFMHLHLPVYDSRDNYRLVLLLQFHKVLNPHLFDLQD